jgi:glycine/D-amino acid oxidase-like deaminating enzyme
MMRAMAPEVPPSRTISYWLGEALAADPGEPCSPLHGETSADVVVLGGGYTGLWTAFHLTERVPGIDVVLLERDIVGSGASGRNGGLVSAWWDELDDLVDRHGEEAGLAAARAMEQSVSAMEAWCREHEVDAWFTRAGCLAVASSPAQEGIWADAVEACRRHGFAQEFRALSPDEVQAICRSPAFGGGAFMPGAASVQPARLARGLRRVLLERGVRIHEHAPAIEARPGPPVVVRTPGGEVRAGRAVLGLNAWSARWPGLGRTVVVRGSYVLVTAPAPERIEELGWTGGEFIFDLRTALNYFRTTPDGRMAFGTVGRARGSRVGPDYDHDPASLGWAREQLHRLFPSFRGVPIEEGWGGAVDLSATHRPWFGTLGGGIHYGVGYTGNGVGPTHLGGRILSALAIDADDPVTRLPMVTERPRRFPPGPIRSIGAQIVQAAILRKDRAEDEGRRAGPVTRLVASLPRRLGYSLGA